MREHSARSLKEKGSERLHGTIDIIPSHLQLFTAADLSSPSHHVPLFTPRVRAPVLNIRMRKCFDGEKVFVAEQYSSNTFSGNEFRPK